MHCRAAPLLSLLLPAVGCGYASYDVLDTQSAYDGGDGGPGVDMGTPDLGTPDLGTPDLGMRVVGHFNDLCMPSMGTVIRDGDPTDDGIGSRLGVAVSGACGAGFTVRTVNQGDSGILSPTDSRPLLGPSDLALVGGYSFHANVMAYLEMRDTPVTWQRTATDYVLRDRATNSLLLARPLTQIDGAHDVGVVQVTVEPISGTIVLNAFGAQNRGALAATYYFEQQIAPTLATDNHSFYVVSWTNADADMNPSAGDAYTVITIP